MKFFLFSLSFCSIIFFLVSVSPAHAQPVQSFTFGAAGDFATGSDYQATVNAAGASGINFFVTTGDNSYTAGAEQSWCNTFTSKVSQIALIAGNHDAGESSGGDINIYRQYCKYTATPITGDFGKQYYFDYPATNPIARFILISPGIKGSLNISYANGGAGYAFTQNAIDTARTKGIKWIIVSMHKNYISAMEKSNELGSDLMPMLFSKKVDLILQGHEHGYERSKQLTCATPGSYNASCVVDSDTSMVKGAGSIIHVIGTGGKTLRSLNTGDSEYPYFASANNTAYGFGKFTVSPTQLSYSFVRGSGGNFSDSFTITDSNQSPTGIVNPTFGVIAPCPSCSSPTTAPTNGVSPSGGALPSGTTTNPSPGIDPCTASGATIAHKSRHKKHKKSRGKVSEFMKSLLNFFIELINMLLKLLGGGKIEPLTNPNTNPLPQQPQEQPC